MYGELVGPSGEPCYTASQAGAILGVGEKRVRQLAGPGKALASDPVLGPHRQVFIIAASVRLLAEQRRRWPPSSLTIDALVADGDDLWSDFNPALLKDLADAQKEIDALKAERLALMAEVERLRADNRSLGVAVAELGALARRSSE